MTDPWRHAVGFDDAPFERDRDTPVLLVGAVYAGARLDGVISTCAQPDGDDATAAIAQCVNASRHATGLRVIFLQGIAVGGFNVIDLPALAAATGKAVIAVARRRPRYLAIARALHRRVPGGAGKWQRLRAAGPMQAVAGVWVQAAGLEDPRVLSGLISSHQRYSRIPEPLRAAHLIAGGVVSGESRARV
ncbi:endonuclease dU [Arhodomonas sp. SL1]|uniref:endonuclease dU n=1 Tax=Arhodomonas sp. SL1 TaxID=3425691 RepID=UPI003F8817F2